MNAHSLPWLRRHPIGATAAALAVLLVLVLLLFDWNWLRGPIARLASSKLHRPVHIGAIDVDLLPHPRVRVDGIELGNMPGAAEPTMARVGSVEAQLSLHDLFKGKVLIPRVAVHDADVLLERDKGGRKNWVFDPGAKPADDKAPSRLRLGGVSLDHGRFRYRDAQLPMEATVIASSIDAAAGGKSGRTDAAPDNQRYASRFELQGQYKGNAFSGTALTGNVLSLQESGIAFPVRAELTAGNTRLHAEGTVADAAKVSALDVTLRMSGDTLANLYPFLLLPLPATPPYDLHGRLRFQGDRYAIDDLGGRIGSTDLSGSGAYEKRAPRPLLTVKLLSNQLDITDLGPLIGVETKSSGGKPQAGQHGTQNRAQAKAQGRAARGDRVLPSGHFDAARLRAIDADVQLEARKLKVTDKLPLESLKTTLQLRDAVLKLEPLEMGMAGGAMVAQVTLDARDAHGGGGHQPSALKSQAQADFRRLRLDRLVPAGAIGAKEAAGLLGMKLDVRGTGDSIADAAANADGRISAAITDGKISNLIDAASGLNGGKVLRVLAGGDEDIALHCGGVVFDVNDGQGKSSLFVVDTAQTQILGEGQFDLDHETFDLRIAPKPKDADILSLRTPVRLYGSFSKPEFALEKTPLVLRAGSALALAAVAPLAALIPLIETGPGKDTDCKRVMATANDAHGEATGPAQRPPGSHAAPAQPAGPTPR